MVVMMVMVVTAMTVMMAVPMSIVMSVSVGMIVMMNTLVRAAAARVFAEQQRFDRHRHGE